MSKSGFDVFLKFALNGDLLKKRGLEDGGPVQRFVDSEVIKLLEPYMPMDTGNLILSGTRGTKLGSGEVIYNAPYAAKQNYHGRAPGTSEKGPLRGNHPFDRMKADHKDDILRAAAKKAGGKAH